MPIPGKYCFGILEEDNPLKSYFRFKPLLVEAEGKYEPFVESESYPEDGCIRIVPDKNESSRFKNRMRRMGRYAVVDLRQHPNENDKIRPNKNYRGDGVEQNANIIYSDVVQEPLNGSVLEVLSLDVPADSTHMALTMPFPGTSHVLIRDSEGALGQYVWAADRMEGINGGVALSRTDITFDGSDLVQFDIAGFHGEQLHFVLAQPDARLIENLPERAEAPLGAELLPGEADAPVRPAEAAKPVETRPAVESESPAQPAEIPAAPIRPEIPRPVRPEMPHPPRALPPEPPRPPRPARLSPVDQALLMQTGLNPRRGRSLQEIIEDKWRHSRLDQLGHPVPPEATGNPVVSPVERAVFAVREAWSQPEARPVLRSALSGIEGLIKDPGVESRAISESTSGALLNDLEAQRLKLLDEINTLKAGRIETHEKIVEEIRDGNARLFAEGEKKLAAQRAELERLEKKIQEANAARQTAEAALDSLAKEDVPTRLGELALSGSTTLAERLRQSGPTVSIGHAPTAALTAGELLSSVRCYFESAGHPITNDAAVNLLACLTLSPVTVLSGPAGSGKSSTAALLAQALGVARAGRLVCLAPSRRPLEETAAYRELTACRDTESPVVALMDDANTRPGEIADALLTHLDGPSANPALRLIVAAQDVPSGLPLRARLLDRAFLIRLRGEAADTDWAPRAVNPAEPEFTVSEEALRAIFAPDAEAVTEAVVQRMQSLRTALSAYGVLLSRRTLNAVWTYCAATTRLMQRDAMAVFDLAFSERVLPAVLATAPLEALHKLPELLKDMPVSLKLLSLPLPLDI